MVVRERSHGTVSLRLVLSAAWRQKAGALPAANHRSFWVIAAAQSYRPVINLRPQ